MVKRKSNANLQAAKKAKNDEFYTRYEDIEKEISHYWPNLKGKWVYSPCDDYRWSEFKNYFVSNFSEIGLKHYTCTNYDLGDGAYSYDYDGETETITPLEGNGDFRSEECIESLKECDVVVTNPPFSLFREYVEQLMNYGKKFIIIGNLNAITYKEIFPLIKENKIWMGSTYFNGGATYFFGNESVFDVTKISNPKNAYTKDGKLYWRVNGVRWFTNVSHEKRNTPLTLYKTYSAENYPKYDNYDAIEVSKVENIPTDYDGVMGVPISFLDKYCPNQFEIVGAYNYSKDYEGKTWNAKINGQYIYKRILIRKKVSE